MIRPVALSGAVIAVLARNADHALAQKSATCGWSYMRDVQTPVSLEALKQRGARSRSR